MLAFRQRRAERGISLCGRQGRLRVGCWMRRGRRPHRHLRPGLLYTIYLHRNTIYLLTHMLAFISPLLYQGFLSVSIVKRSRTTPKSIIYRERSSKVAQTHYQKAISATKLLIHQYQEIKCNIAQIDRSQIRVESRIEEPESHRHRPLNIEQKHRRLPGDGFAILRPLNQQPSQAITAKAMAICMPAQATRPALPCAASVSPPPPPLPPPPLALWSTHVQLSALFMSPSV